MKTTCLLLLLIIISSSSISQIAPPVEWRKTDWAPITPIGPMAIQTTNPKPQGTPQTSDESGEDWWYDIINIEENGEHVGYMTCGFTRWPGYYWDGLCKYDGTVDAEPDCLDRYSANDQMSPYASSIARYDLDGNMVWCRAYTLGGDGTFAIIRDSDGNYITVGNADDIYDIKGNEVPMYHTPNSLPTYLSTLPSCASLVKKTVVTKIAPDGTVIWTNFYDDKPNNLGQNLHFAGFGLDVVEKADNSGYIIVGTTETAFNTPNNEEKEQKIVLYDIAKNGVLNNLAVYGNTNEVSFARNILQDASGNLYVSGQDGPESSKVGLVFKVDSNLDLDAGWGNVWNSSNNPFHINPMNNQSIGQDLLFDNNGDLIVSSIHCVGGCNGSGNNQGQAYIQNVNASNGLEITSINYPQNIGFVRAFDMKIGMTNTNDGGFAMVSSTRLGPAPDINSPLYENGAIWIDFNNYISEGVSDTICKDPDLNYWQTDAYVAKFDADGAKLWETTFDVDDAAPEYWPGDFKKQECLYRITEAADGGLVIVGNTSHNMDDYYLAKVASDCNITDTYDLGNYTLTNNETWSFAALGQNEYKINGVITIPSGITLTVTDGFIAKFADSRITSQPCKLVVEAGGQLLVENGAMLTSSDCPNSMWEGIEVLGDAFAPQSISNNSPQGIAQFNNAIIENAVNGVRTISYNNGVFDWSKTGGVILANNSTFRNNWRAIEFMTYPHPSSSITLSDNLSSFSECSFETTENLPFPYDKPYAFITLYRVNGVDISANSFNNNILSNIAESDRGIGILSLDASYNVISTCDVVLPVGTPCPTANQNRNTFNRLYAGIVGKQGGSTGDINVNKADFTNCVYGIRAEGSYLNEITECNFQISKGDASFPNNPSHFGIFASGSNGSLFEDNNFEHNGQVGAGTGRNLGVSTGLQYVTPTDVVKNEFTGLETGVQLWGDNTDPAVQVTQADCNNFNRTDNTTADIHHSSGLLAPQGNCSALTTDPTEPASNQFFGVCDGNAFKWQLYSNTSTLGFQYNAYTINTGDFPYNACSSGNIDLRDCIFESSIPGSFDLSQACPNQVVSGPFMVKIDAWKQRYTFSQNTLSNLQQLYDGGNTSNLINLISTQSNGQLKNTLLGASPYLSDEVLKAYVLSSPPPGHLKQVLIANSSLSNDILDLLETQNIPNGILNQIYAAQTGEPSDRDFLDAEINYTANRKLSNLNGLIRTYLDTNMLDSAVYYVENDNSLNASCLILPLALKSDTNRVKQHINIIQNEAHVLSGLGRQGESDELNRFCNFYSFLMKIANRNGGYYSITDQEKQILQNFASTPSVVSSNARAILEFISNDLSYIDAEPYLQLNSYQIEEEITPNGTLNSNGKLNAYPNPFSGQFFVEGELEGDPINARLKIMDASGRLLFSQEINNGSFNLSIDMSSYDAGLYLIGVINNGELVAVKRIIQK